MAGFGLNATEDSAQSGTIYKTQEAHKYSKILLEGEGTLYLSFRDFNELIKKHLTEPIFDNIRAVDYGCGAGRSSRYLKHLGIHRVEGFDISSNMITEALSSDPQGSYTLIESGAIPAPDATYDLALMSFITQAIESKEELFSIFKELNRTVKPGGLIMSLTLSEDFWNPHRSWITYKQDYPENYNPISGQKSRLTITSVDLELIDIYWSDSDVIESAEKAGLVFVEKHNPLGKPQDGIPWQDEAVCAPYTILIFRGSCNTPRP